MSAFATTQPERPEPVLAEPSPLGWEAGGPGSDGAAHVAPDPPADADSAAPVVLAADGPEGLGRHVWCEVDLAAIGHNAATMAKVVAPARLCAVVKADGYGHGLVPAATAALAGGATWLAVAFVEEGLGLRRGGVEAPILLLSQPPEDAFDQVVARRLIPTLYTPAGVVAMAAAVDRQRSGPAAVLPGAQSGANEAGGPSRAPFEVHVKVDTGMHRVGATPEVAVAVAQAVAAHPQLRLGGLFTHLAVADEPAHPANRIQAKRFDDVRVALAARGIGTPVVHAANSAGAMLHPGLRFDLVRCGIAIYGLGPRPGLGHGLGLKPALELKARVSHVSELEPGDSVSYGLQHRVSGAGRVATVPIGYADGIPWSLGCGKGEVLIGGARRPIAGRVTMDQIMVDCSAGPAVSVGDEVVLIGSQSGRSIGAWDWAAAAGTIAYEILCRIGPRVPRVYR
ncbi:MAG: alanine racemase [Acidimicrobiales bacterium]